MSNEADFSNDPRILKVKKLMNAYKDFPKPGIVFRDIFPVLQDPAAFSDLIDVVVDLIKSTNPDVEAIVGLESRGFLFGIVIAQKLKISFVPVRKAGKLPGPTHKMQFELEYGKDMFEIQKSALKAQQKVIIVDDLLATGGTMSAASKLMSLAEANILQCLVIVELSDLEGRKKQTAPIRSLIQF